MRTKRSVSSTGMERRIMQCNTSMLKRRLTFDRGIFQFWAKNNKREESTFAYTGKTEKKRRFNEQICTSTRARPFYWSRLNLFCLLNSCSSVISDWCSYHLDGSSFWVQTFIDLSQRLLECIILQSRSRGSRSMPYTPVRCGTGHSFRDTRTMLYTPVSCGTVHFFHGTSIEREHLLVLCLRLQ